MSRQTLRPLYLFMTIHYTHCDTFCSHSLWTDQLLEAIAQKKKQKGLFKFYLSPDAELKKLAQCKAKIDSCVSILTMAFTAQLNVNVCDTNVFRCFWNSPVFVTFVDSSLTRIVSRASR